MKCTLSIINITEFPLRLPPSNTLEMLGITKISLARRQRGRVVRELNLKSEDPEFKSLSDQ